MKKNIIEIREVGSEDYHNVLNNKLDINKRKYIDNTVYGDVFVLAYDENNNAVGGVAVNMASEQMIYINGLFSLKKGVGSMVIDWVIDNPKWKTIRFVELVCLGDGLKDYYETKYFFPYWSIITYNKNNPSLHKMCHDKKFGEAPSFPNGE